MNPETISNLNLVTFGKSRQRTTGPKKRKTDNLALGPNWRGRPEDQGRTDLKDRTGRIKQGPGVRTTGELVDGISSVATEMVPLQTVGASRRTEAQRQEPERKL
ncbi:uncharacterized protein LOC118416297 [Branchiostoma floridae]|uniref:Uncharacterized protein LOC118416297 n=1 Tax=Branchiostoma floridae TaxID=7739 RepID=A0A9J7L8G5_BRAFL|nr:uncharacterized protein LOC118416297 [Branchiostoma floridae]